MNEITFQDYIEFIRKHDHVMIENVRLEIGGKWPIETYSPTIFKLETTTVWSFPNRGKWATHYLNAKYRGNWAPQVVRNLILRYSEPGETILDAFIGSGTTLIECKLLGRNGIGVDINKDAIMLSWDRLNFNYSPTTKTQTILTYTEEQNRGQEIRGEPTRTIIRLYHGDARNLDKIRDNEIDLIVTHPPYANIISYTGKEETKEGDLSKIMSISEFILEMEKVAKEFYRVLKPGKYVAILVGDTRKHKHYVPIAYKIMQKFLNIGFILKEDIIKLQHNMLGTISWKEKENDFYLIVHEHLFIFRKPKEKEELNKYKESSYFEI
ncbi:MAG: DNA methyltransferase [Nitrososphaeria archaeon]|nr:DNA methyltransferase [Nitrososphaeria archaeon]